MGNDNPVNLKYSKEHEWADISLGSIVTIGITLHAQEALGDIVFLELPAVGKVVKQGDTIGVVESIKAVSDIYSPVTGKISEVHSSLVSEPGKINTDPYKEGWLVKVEVSDRSTLDGLLDSEQYFKFVSSLK